MNFDVFFNYTFDSLILGVSRKLHPKFDSFETFITKSIVKELVRKLVKNLIRNLVKKFVTMITRMIESKGIAVTAHLIVN